MQDWTDLVAPMSRWLASGHAMHLRLTGLGYGTGHCEYLTDALATSPTLSHLYLDAPLILLASLVGSGRQLRHITQFECAGLGAGQDFQAIFVLLPLDKLTKLRLYGAPVDNTNLSWLLPRLHLMTALEDLHLSDVRMVEALAMPLTPSLAPRLRSVRLPKVSCSVESRRALLGWALHSNRLECLTWPQCATDDGHCFDGDGLCHAIEAGVRTIDLKGSFSRRDAMALANVLRGAKAPHSATLCLHHSPLRRAGELHLQKALATCTNVVITTRDSDNAIRTLLAA
ncbi:hypothetical protein SDRG_02406 [Saprolegnia diclina VS20]|uniref:Uncharacterized protein n=1 Tax=Saprolegnia diclina (strain VS20) TaxID=1156394 RepID=T0R0Q7_SAPDV|nr:hypothetical protein SDRG_02406 [Saprolegnia diclina VS20]EQC40516.1 hypothetical protein SDRG_02406 [Saprolegnia diclina VS20]|eukprot:XP_008606215.1 hypothetical protein SDRG_02406 [Saprolegnia diclina VS20]